MTEAPGGTSSTAPPREVMERLETALGRLSSLADEPRRVEVIEGGLTNVTVKVTTPRRTAVVRLSGSDGGVLDIDRDAEYVNSLRAARSGAAPEVLERLPDLGVLVVAWVEGRTLAADDLRDEATLARVATACRLLHAGPSFAGDFDMVEVQRRYLRIVQDRGYRVPARYLDLMPQVDRIADALAVRREPTVPCHNDLVAANLVDDGDRLWVIDYEYAGNNDACFELGNLWAESNLSPDHLRVLVERYFGTQRRHPVARARLYGLLARYGWTLWASIQAAVSPIDFDFWSWGTEEYERALAELDGPDFDRLLDDARRPD